MMELKKISTHSNVLLVGTNEYLFSYGVCVACKTVRGDYRRAGKWAVPTVKHINAFGAKHLQRISANKFNSLINGLMGG